MNAIPQISTPQPLSAAAILALLPTLNFSAATQREITSAIRFVVTVAAVPAEDVPFSCDKLRSLLYGVAPRQLGVEPDRHKKIVSLLRRLLREVGLHAPFEQGSHSLSPAWRSLHDALGSRFRQMPLIDFMRFCSHSGIAPDTVTAETLAAFEQWCLTWKLEDDTAGKARRAASNWTWARTEIAGWPEAEIVRPSMHDHYGRPLDVYPPSFIADVNRLKGSLAMTNTGSIFTKAAALPKTVMPFTGHRSGRSRRKPLRPRTIKTREQGILFAAAALPLEDVTTLRDLVQPVERVERILTFHIDRLQKRRADEAMAAGRPDLAARASETIQSAHLANIAEVLRQIARFHCNPPLPADDIVQITEWTRMVTPPQQNTMNPAIRERLRRLIQSEKRAALLHLPDELMRQVAAPNDDGTPVMKPAAQATRALYALALEIVLVCPLRLTNLASLRLDTQLVRATTGRRMVEALKIDTTDVKNGREIFWAVPERLARMIQTFIEVYRPRLLDRTANVHLFPGAGGKARNASELGTALSELVTREIGTPINTHLMRHFSAWRYLQRHVGAYEVVRLMLGHSTTATVSRFYAGLEIDAVARHVDQTLLEDRRDTQATAAAIFRKRRGRPPGSKNKPKTGGAW